VQPYAGADNLPLIEAEPDRDPRLKSANVKRGYLADLGAFESWRAGRPLSKLLAEAYAAELQRAGRSPNSINRALAALRWWARRLGDLAQEAPCQRQRRRAPWPWNAGARLPSKRAGQPACPT
jgi:hypothetical protein